eukprot:COSAG02_NODE_1378_length_12990_cov_3.643705_7_plen_148_part_00
MTQKLLDLPSFGNLFRNRGHFTFPGYKGDRGHRYAGRPEAEPESTERSTARAARRRQRGDAERRGSHGTAGAHTCTACIRRSGHCACQRLGRSEVVSACVLLLNLRLSAATRGAWQCSSSSSSSAGGSSTEPAAALNSVNCWSPTVS